MRARVATWNVHSCVGTDGRCDPGRVAEVLAAIDADVIGLQEVDSRYSRTGGVAHAEFLADRLGLHLLVGPNLVEADGDFGNVLLSREAAEDHARIDLSVPGVEPRGAIDALIPVDGGRLRTVVTHLGLRAAERRRQLTVLRRLLDAPRPRAPAAVEPSADGTADGTVLLGDFNEWRERPFDAAGFGRSRAHGTRRLRTFPSRLPLIALDRILAMAHPLPPRFREVHTVRTPLARTASDHLPVVAELEWRPAHEASPSR